MKNWIQEQCTNWECKHEKVKERTCEIENGNDKMKYGKWTKWKIENERMAHIKQNTMNKQTMETGKWKMGSGKLENGRTHMKNGNMNIWKNEQWHMKNKLDKWKL